MSQLPVVTTAGSRRCRGSPLRPPLGSLPSLRRTWIERFYREEELCLLEEEVLPAIERCMARVEEIDQAQACFRSERMAEAARCPGAPALKREAGRNPLPSRS